MSSQIIPVRNAQDIETIGALFREYAAGLDIDLDFQGFGAELADLPGKYAPPQGELLLARDETGAALGCVGLRPFEPPHACEVKRLYVRATARGTGLGRALATSILDAAVAAGYSRVMLDTVKSMGSAISLYRRLGFEAIPPYRDGVVPSLLYFGKNLPVKAAQASGA